MARTLKPEDRIARYRVVGPLAAGGMEPEPDSARLHYISMELVSGDTLSTKIHREKIELKALLGHP